MDDTNLPSPLNKECEEIEEFLLYNVYYFKIPQYNSDMAITVHLESHTFNLNPCPMSYSLFFLYLIRSSMIFGLFTF